MSHFVAFASAFALLAGGFVASDLAIRRKNDSGVKVLGPKIVDAYSKLFNDQELTKKGIFGSSRDPLWNAHLGVGKPWFGAKYSVASQVALSDARAEAVRENYHLEEGIFSHALPFSAGENGVNHPVQWMHTDSSTPTLFAQKFHTVNTVDVGLDQFAQEISKIAKEKPVTLHRGGFKVYAAPVRFEHEECLSCHKGARLNDTAAVIALAFRKTHS